MGQAIAPRSLRSIAADQLGQRNVGHSFGPKSLGGRRPDRGGVVLRRRGAAIQPAAGDGRCAGRAPASGGVETGSGPDPRPQRAAPRRAAHAAGAGRGGAVSQCRRLARRPQSLCRCGRALQGRSPAGVGQIPRAAVEHAEDGHGAQQGGSGRQERHHAEAGDPQHRRRDAGHRRGRQRVRRPVLHPRLRRPQRRLHRRRARFRRQRPREFLHRAGRDPARPGLVALPAAAPPAARSTSSPSRRPPKKASTTWTPRSAPTRPSASCSTSTR